MPETLDPIIFPIRLHTDKPIALGSEPYVSVRIFIYGIDHAYITAEAVRKTSACTEIR